MAVKIGLTVLRKKHFKKYMVQLVSILHTEFTALPVFLPVNTQRHYVVATSWRHPPLIQRGLDDLCHLWTCCVYFRSRLIPTKTFICTTLYVPGIPCFCKHKLFDDIIPQICLYTLIMSISPRICKVADSGNTKKTETRGTPGKNKHRACTF